MLTYELSDTGVQSEIAHFTAAYAPEDYDPRRDYPLITTWRAILNVLDRLDHPAANAEMVAAACDIFTRMVRAFLPTTQFQQLLLRLIHERPNCSARTLSEILWPNSVGHGRRFNVGQNGSAAGVGMPMAAGSQAAKLIRKGWVRHSITTFSVKGGHVFEYRTGYELTHAGRIAVKAVTTNTDELHARHLAVSTYERPTIRLVRHWSRDKGASDPTHVLDGDRYKESGTSIPLLCGGSSFPLHSEIVNGTALDATCLECRACRPETARLGAKIRRRG